VGRNLTTSDINVTLYVLRFDRQDITIHFVIVNRTLCLTGTSLLNLLTGLPIVRIMGNPICLVNGSPVNENGVYYGYWILDMDIVKDYLGQNLCACDNLIRDWILDAELLLDGRVSVVFVVGNHEEDKQRPFLCPEISSTYVQSVAYILWQTWPNCGPSS
jgi:hypothetical protein